MNAAKAAMILSHMLDDVDDLGLRPDEIDALTFAYSAVQNLANEEQGKEGG